MSHQNESSELLHPYPLPTLSNEGLAELRRVVADFKGTLPKVDASSVVDANIEADSMIRVTATVGRFTRTLQSSTGERGYEYIIKPIGGQEAVLVVIVRESLIALFRWVEEQSRKGNTMPVLDVELQKEGESRYLVVEARTRHRLTVELSTEWSDTLAVFVGQTPIQFRPGEGQRNARMDRMITGPGEINVHVINSGGKGVEIIGNWSINLHFRILVDGQPLPGAAGHISGWEPRGKTWIFGPFPYGPRG